MAVGIEIKFILKAVAIRDQLLTRFLHAPSIDPFLNREIQKHCHKFASIVNKSLISHVGRFTASAGHQQGQQCRADQLTVEALRVFHGFYSIG